MKQNFKRTVSVLLAVIMLFSIIPFANSFAASIVDSGQCGDNVYWTIDSEGTVVISGEGPTWDLSTSYLPPIINNLSINSVVIQHGVTSIGRGLFVLCHNITDVTIPNSITKIGYAAFYSCTELTDVYYAGSEEQWRQIEIGELVGLIGPTIHYNYVDGNDNTPKFPGGYDNSKDVWSFSNPSDKISANIWKWCFPNASADELKKAEENSGGGLCYGMTATAINLNSHIVQTPYDFNNKTVADISKNDKSNSLGLTALQYIGFMQTAQCHPMVTEEYNSNINNLQALLDAVKKYQNSGSENAYGVNIGIHGRYFGSAGHSVWGIKAFEYEDHAEILVYDSNHPREDRYLYLYKDDNGNYTSWSYNLFLFCTWGTGHKDAEISFDTKSAVAYAGLYLYLNGETITEDDFLRYNRGYNLIKTRNANFNTNEDAMQIHIANVVKRDDLQGDPEDDIYVDNNAEEYYWTKGKTLTFTPNGENAAFKVAGDNTAISVDEFTGSGADVTVDDENNSVRLSLIKGSLLSTAFTTFNDNGEKIEIIISGKSSNTTVTAKQTETGIIVTGISDGTVTLTKDEGVISSQEIENAVSDVEIVYDKDGNTDNMEVEYKTKTEDAADSVCKYCGKTHGSSFWDRIVAFFHNIFYFFKNLFK